MSISEADISREDNARSQKRKSIDFLPVANDLLWASDIVAGIVTGKLTLFTYYTARSATPFDFVVNGSFWREIILGSVLASIVLREPRMAADRMLFIPANMVARIRLRGVAALALLLFIGTVTRATDDMARLWLVMWACSFGLCVAGSRILFLEHVRWLLCSGALREAVAIVSLPGTTGRMAKRLAREAEVVLNVGIGDGSSPHGDPGVCSDSLRVGGALEDVLALGRCGAIDSVVVALSEGGNPDLTAVVDQLKSLPVQIVLCPEACAEMGDSTEARLMGGVAMSVLVNRPIRAWDFLAKLILDKVLSLLLLVLLAPLMLVIALAIASDDAGPVIFRQQRSGWCGRSFIMFKFRTMRNGTASPFMQARRRDPRCTRVGAFLRRTSLDELPQLLNVLAGDMSLVGPRPHVDALQTTDVVGQRVVAEYAQRYRVKPGMTGWAQVNGFRGGIASIEELRRRVEYDLFYIENWSLLFDLKILLLTPFSVMSGENAF
jgi:Undecaprenyl-phosphate glucose phosphotransferase